MTGIATFEETIAHIATQIMRHRTRISCIQRRAMHNSWGFGGREGALVCLLR